ncbi:MAG: hypothetical protein WAZ99_05885 [Rectinemataceae bacterium]
MMTVHARVPFLAMAAVLVLAGQAVAQNMVGAELSAEPSISVTWADEFSSKESFSAKLEAGLGSVGSFEVFGTLSANSDGAYAPALANLPGGDFGNIYFLMEEGGLRTRLGPVLMEAGRIRHFDEIQGPYSLFVNSAGIAAPLLRIRYEDDNFIYESRWIELNRNSLAPDPAGTLDPEGNVAEAPAWENGYPDRGANLKTYGFKVGNMRFGFQDAAVYSGRFFDAEYFLNPIPQYFIQYGRGTPGSPWAEDSNDNDIIGAFWDLTTDDGAYVAVQAFMDDFNIHFIAPSTSWSPWKAGLSLRAAKDTSWGRFGFSTAGATKYSFEPIDMKNLDTSEEWWKSAYGYTYFPDTRFDIEKDSSIIDWEPISPGRNMIGYINGENNFAFQVDWKDDFGDFDIDALIEFKLTGAQSPANPWQDSGSNPNDGTHWIFGEPVLEKRVLAMANASYRLGGWAFFGTLKAGIALDALALALPSATSGDGLNGDGIEKQIAIWTPQAGLVETAFSVGIGASYSIR